MVNFKRINFVRREQGYTQPPSSLTVTPPASRRLPFSRQASPLWWSSILCCLLGSPLLGHFWVHLALYSTSTHWYSTTIVPTSTPERETIHSKKYVNSVLQLQNWGKEPTKTSIKAHTSNWGEKHKCKHIKQQNLPLSNKYVVFKTFPQLSL